MTNLTNQRGLLPAGLSDVLHPNAKIQAKKIEKLLDTFSSFGYLRIKPPLVEYEDSLLSEGPGNVLKDSTFRIMDPLSQKMMALRSDMTAQISRISSTRLSHLPRPLRLSYSGDVLRVNGDSFNMERQKTQVGAELIGNESVTIDAEIILVCLESLSSIDINDITLDLNLPFLRAYLLRNIPVSSRNIINEAIDRKDKNVIKKLKIDSALQILKLMEAAGDYESSKSNLSLIGSNVFLSKAIDYLLNVAKSIKENNPSVNITLDPLENRGFKYHSGLSFTIFSKNTRGEIAKGGRYLTVSNETDTGCNIYTEKIYNTAKDFIENKLVYVPFLNINDANSIINKGYDIIFGTRKNDDVEQEAHEMGCKYIFKNETIIELT